VELDLLLLPLPEVAVEVIQVVDGEAHGQSRL